MRRAAQLMVWLAATAIAVAAPATGLIAAVLLAPAGLAAAVGGGTGLARPVLLAGLAATLPSLIELTSSGSDVSSTLAATIPLAWIGQLITWTIAELGPPVVEHAFAASVSRRAARLAEARDRQLEHWATDDQSR